VADPFDARCKTGTAPDASRECGSQPADQSLSTDVQEASPPPVRDDEPETASGRRRPVLHVLGVDDGHQSGV
jgi:hypothetical protein